jgi:hypothetical protein
VKKGERIKAALKRARSRYLFRKHRPARFSRAERKEYKRRFFSWKRKLEAFRRELARKRVAKAEAAAEAALWGGSRVVTNEVIRIVGNRAPVTSRKRTETFGNPGSDHHVSQTTADAVDFGIGEAHWLKNEISRKLGGPASLPDYGSFGVTRNGRRFRVQLIAGTHGTGPHLHVGVRRV